MAAPNPVLRTIQEDKDQVIVQVIVPSGGDTDLSASLIADASTYTVGTTSSDLTLMEVWYSLERIGATIEFNADTNVVAVSLAGSGHIDLSRMGGIINNAGTGKNGDIDMSTNGLTAGTLGDPVDGGGMVILRLRKD